MEERRRILLTGNEAVARACLDARVQLGSGYPGTPSTEILEEFDRGGGRAQWAPNEKVALEVALGAAFGNARAIAVMKHVGVNVAADPLFSSAYTGVTGALVVVSGDDPGMSSSQNEQDNRHYARAAGLPMLEPADAQEAYDYTILAFELSHRWEIPVLLRLTTRVCHTSSLVTPLDRPLDALVPGFVRDRRGRVLLPGFARIAHGKLREKLADIEAWNETSALVVRRDGDSAVGIVTSGVSWLHACEAAPRASVLKLGMTHPLPLQAIRAFAASVDRCVVVEEGDPYLHDAVRAAGVRVAERAEGARFGELDVARVGALLRGEPSAPTRAVDEAPPELCMRCPHRAAYAMLSQVDCIVAGDIGCYTLGSLEPFSIMDSVVCMGASIGVGLGLRHVLPEHEASRVISVIGDGTFLHSGVTGVMEMVYNAPATGHVVLLLDNGTTAMTGMQPHPGTGRTLDQQGAGKVDYVELSRVLGVKDVFLINPGEDPQGFLKLIHEGLERRTTTLIVVKNPCGLDKPRDRAPARPILGGHAADLGDPSVRNVVFIGRGGQGLMLASTILAEALVRLGYDVKRSATVGLAQRGGSVRSDLRFGARVQSPIVPAAGADFVVLTDLGRRIEEQGVLGPEGVLVRPVDVGDRAPWPLRGTNIALLGRLSAALGLPAEPLEERIRHHLRHADVDANLDALARGRASWREA